MTGWAFVVNLAASLALMWRFGAVGLAGANLISSAVQSFLLQRALMRGRTAFGRENLMRSVRHIAAAALAMALSVWLCWKGILHFSGPGKLADALAVCLVIPAAMLLYFWVLCRCGFEDKALLGRFFDKLLRRSAA